jgi:transcription factor CP2 and related proteins
VILFSLCRDAKNPEDELNAWAFWHQRQPTNKQRIIDAETNNLSDECGIARIEDLAYNAISVYWSPLQKPAFISLAIQCLSTDFSLQKGVKGLPMHLQIDTYARSGGDGGDFDDLVHRGYCQVKVFCDKGAERKFRQEERRAARKVAAGGQRVLDMYHQCQERSEFYAMVDLSRDPVLYTPSAVGGGAATGLLTPPPSSATAGFLAPGAGSPGSFPSVIPSSPGQSLLKQNGGGVGGGLLADFIGNKRRKTQPPPDTRMVVYVRQENEEIYTPLHLVPPTVPGEILLMQCTPQ